MDNFYKNIFKIIKTVGMCEKHYNDLTYKLNEYFKTNKYDDSLVYKSNENSGGCCKNNEAVANDSCCKYQKTGNNLNSDCCKLN